MRNAFQHGIRCILHHGLVALVLIMMIYGLHAGWIIDSSGFLLTGAVAAKDTLTASLELNADATQYIQKLNQQQVFVTRIDQHPGSLILISGYAKNVLPALLKTAELAQSQGHLVAYSIAE